MKTWHVFLGCTIFLGVVFGSLSLAGHLNRKREHEFNTRAYQAWIKLTGRTDITREEFMALRYSGALRTK
jgi:hypothetical protein